MKRLGFFVLGFTVFIGIAVLLYRMFSGKAIVVKLSVQNEIYKTIQELIKEKQAHPENAAQIKQEILELLLEKGLISQEQYDAKMRP